MYSMKKYIFFMIIFLSFNLFSNNLLIEGELPMTYNRILKIARIGNPILRQIAKEITDPTSREIKQVIQDMKDTFDDFQGSAVGLAAPQVNFSLKIVIVQVPEVEKTNFKGFPLTVMINPSYKPLSNEIINDYEGCLSIPGFMGLVPRYKDIKYTYLDEDVKIHEEEAHGYLARVIQHETDHVNGILYIDRMKDLSTFGLVEEIQKKRNE